MILPPHLGACSVSSVYFYVYQEVRNPWISGHLRVLSNCLDRFSSKHSATFVRGGWLVVRRTIGIMDILSPILAIDYYWTAITVTAFLIGLRTITSTELLLELWSRPCLLALKASLLGPLSPQKKTLVTCYRALGFGV